MVHIPSYFPSWCHMNTYSYLCYKSALTNLNTETHQTHSIWIPYLFCCFYQASCIVKLLLFYHEQISAELAFWLLRMLSGFPIYLQCRILRCLRVFVNYNYLSIRLDAWICNHDSWIIYKYFRYILRAPVAYFHTNPNWKNTWELYFETSHKVLQDEIWSLIGMTRF